MCLCVQLFEDGPLVWVQEGLYSSVKWRVQHTIKIQDKCGNVFVCVAQCGTWHDLQAWQSWRQFLVSSCLCMPQMTAWRQCMWVWLGEKGSHSCWTGTINKTAAMKLPRNHLNLVRESVQECVRERGKRVCIDPHSFLLICFTPPSSIAWYIIRSGLCVFMCLLNVCGCVIVWFSHPNMISLMQACLIK